MYIFLIGMKKKWGCAFCNRAIKSSSVERLDNLRALDVLIERNLKVLDMTLLSFLSIPSYHFQHTHAHTYIYTHVPSLSPALFLCLAFPIRVLIIICKMSTSFNFAICFRVCPLVPTASFVGNLYPFSSCAYSVFVIPLCLLQASVKD